MASVVDRPTKSTSDDKLDIENYSQGLIKFISSSSTPMTIGIQGEWGSGKTSLLNMIKEDLCTDDGAFYPVWINTWEYSLLASSDEVLIKIISGLVLEIGNLTKNNKNWKKNIEVVASAIESLGDGVGGISGTIAKITAGWIKSASDQSHNNSIRVLRDALQKVINEAIEESGGQKEAFIFFIDDLDRLDPAVAVQILELIKNLFDLEKCIFVLAIDYGVVVKGLQSKFGVMTEENEWEFRAFFDKIIQLPFTMPISSYDVRTYLRTLLISVEYFNEDELKNKEILQSVAELVELSVGTNPRALVRLANSAGLINNMRSDAEPALGDKVIEFALICIQIAYPYIYGLIQKEPDFTKWNEVFVSDVLRNKKIDMSELEKIYKKSPLFDEEWEKNIWQVCQVSSYLKQRVFKVSELLNKIKELILKSQDDEIADVLTELLKNASITSVSAETAVANKKTKRVSKKIEAFRKAMEPFVQNELQQRFSQFLDNEYISNIKLSAQRNSGKLYFTVKKNGLDFDFCIDTNYSRATIYVDNRNGKQELREKTIKWFKENLQDLYPNMKINDSKSQKNKIVVLDVKKISGHEGKRALALEMYKDVIIESLEVFLPKIAQ